MKAGWKVKALGDIVVLAYGKPLPKSDRVSDGAFGVYGANGIKDFSNKFYAKGPSIIVGRKGSAGELKYVEEDFWPLDVTYFTQHNADIIDLKFLMFLLEMQNLPAMARGVKPGINRNDVYALKTALPPLEEQKRIVAILDAAFEGLTLARTHIETNLQNARELFDEQSRRLLSKKSGDWIDAKLSEVCEKISDGTHQTPKYFDEGYIFLSSKNVTSRKIDWDNVKYIDEAQHVAMHKRIAPRRGDVLLAKNGTTGVAAMVDRDTVFDIYVSLAHLRPLDILTSEFLLYFVNSKMAKEQFNSRLKGQGVPNLHLKEIREVKISFPKNKAEQEAIVAKVEDLLNKLTNLEECYRAKLQDLDDLRQSLLQKAFAGELT